MDTSNSMGWNSGINSLTGGTPKREAVGFNESLRQQGEVAEALGTPGDQVSITAAPTTEAPMAFEAAPQTQAPTAAPTATPRESVPSLLVDEGPGSLVGSNPFAQKDSVAGLGVLSMIDETVAAHEVAHTEAVRAIDESRGTNAFADLNLVGPGNAARFLNNPEALYLGV